MSKKIITISREFGSGGHTIGKAVAERLGIKFYDKNLLDEIAVRTGFSKEFVEEASEYATSKSSLLFYLSAGHVGGNMGITPNPADQIYIAQSKMIKEIAEKESCVIVGRCADYILRERDDVMNVFICSDKESRAKRVLKKYGETNKSINSRLDDKDKRRKVYYLHYTDRSWGAPQNYTVSLNSGIIGEEKCVDIIVDLFNLL